jgi:hypothetical protein
VRITGSRAVPGSLGISAGTITWTTAAGERGSVPARASSGRGL